MQKLMLLKKRVDSLIDDFMDTEMFYSFAEMTKGEMEQRANILVPSFYKFEPSYGEYVPNTDAETVWANKWDNLIVWGVASKFKDSESSTTESQLFQQRFETELNLFVQQHQLPVQYLDNDTTQQFTTKVFTINKPTYNGDNTNIKFYVNNVRVVDNGLISSDDNYTFIYLGSFTDNTDTMTVVWAGTNGDTGRKSYGW